MTIIYITEDNCESYAVTYRNKNQFRVEKQEDIGNDKNIIYEVNPMDKFVGKSQLCDMTEFSGAKDREVIDGNNILLRLGIENNKHKYVYIGGDQVCSFLTDDEIYKYISNMGSNLSPYSIAIGEKNIYYLKPHFKFSKKQNIDEDDIDELINYDNISNCQKLKTYKIHSKYD